MWTSFYSNTLYKPSSKKSLKIEQPKIFPTYKWRYFGFGRFGY